jgi:hypothetical protein
MTVRMSFRFLRSATRCDNCFKNTRPIAFFTDGRLREMTAIPEEEFSIFNNHCKNIQISLFLSTLPSFSPFKSSRIIS